MESAGPSNRPEPSNQKRVMCYMASMPSVFGHDADNLFNFVKDKMEIKIRFLNHGGRRRFWLAVNFCRSKKCDFGRDATMSFNDSQRQICEVLGIA